LPPDAFVMRETTKAPMRRDERLAIGAILLLMLPVGLYWGCYEQQGNTIALWVDQYTNRQVLGGEIPVTWFQSLNPFMIFAFTPFIVAFWRRQGSREPSTVAKMAIGCLLNALAYLVLAVAAWNAAGAQASWLWLFGYFVILTIGELYLSPTGLSMVTKVAPVRLLSMMMGVWLATSFIGGFLAGYLGTFWSSLGKPEFFLMLAIVSAIAAAAIALLIRPLRAILKD
jgi:POT family proton-dependent oligopeptide transporter